MFNRKEKQFLSALVVTLLSIVGMVLLWTLTDLSLDFGGSWQADALGVFMCVSFIAFVLTGVRAIRSL